MMLPPFLFDTHHPNPYREFISRAPNADGSGNNFEVSFKPLSGIIFARTDGKDERLAIETEFQTPVGNYLRAHGALADYYGPSTTRFKPLSGIIFARTISFCLRRVK